MTPLQGEPAGNPAELCTVSAYFNMGLEKFPRQTQHELSGRTTNEKFRTPSVVKMAIGFH